MYYLVGLKNIFLFGCIRSQSWLGLFLEELSSCAVGSAAGAPGLSCPPICGILVPRLGMKLCPLLWKADSLPLDHQGSPYLVGFDLSFDFYVLDYEIILQIHDIFLLVSLIMTINRLFK